MSTPLPPIVEFDMDLCDPYHFMERVHDISQQLGQQLPEELLDKLDLPHTVTAHCSLSTITGTVAIVKVERSLGS